MKTENLVIFGIFIGFSVLEILFSKFFNQEDQQKSDGWVEGTSTILLLAVIQPAIIAGVGVAMALFLPQYENMLASLPILAIIGLLLLADDMLQYWWHRLCHSIPFMYNLHRPHHQGSYMSTRIIFRNGVFYYLTLPGIYVSGVLIFMGMGEVYAYYLVTKLFIVISSHSNIRWDMPLYRLPVLSQIMWIVERIIITPTFHSAHHGRHKSDGVTNYKGNYGNMLSIWDQLFGTAHITRQLPDQYGIENLPLLSGWQQLFWPLVWAPLPREETGHDSVYSEKKPAAAE